MTGEQHSRGADGLAVKKHCTYFCHWVHCVHMETLAGQGLLGGLLSCNCTLARKMVPMVTCQRALMQ